MQRLLSRVLCALIFAAIALTTSRGVACAELFPGASPAPGGAPGATQQGIYQTVPIALDGATLFRIAAPINEQTGLPVTIRASYVENALAQLTAQTAGERTVYDPFTLQIRVRSEGYQAVIEAVDAHHSQGFPIVTVTSVDAKFAQTTVPLLAAQWRSTLQSALYRALIKRQPAVQRRSATTALQVGAVLMVITVLLWIGIVSLRRRIAMLEKQLSARHSELAADRTVEQPERSEHVRRRRTLALALRIADPEQRLNTLHAIGALLIWTIVLTWFAYFTWVFYLFPETTPLARDISRRTIRIGGIWIVAMLANRALDVIIARGVRLWLPTSYAMTPEDRARHLLRIPTTTRAIEGFKSFVVIFLAVLATVAQLGLPIAGVVTFGGLAAIGISFAAQNFLRDFLSGFLVIVEDQYAIGDFITINNTFSGVVEQVTLRMVQLRDTAGNLITAGHGTVTNVINRSRNWSRVDYRIAIDPHADIDRAIELLRAAIDDVAKEQQYHDVIWKPIEWIGVDAASRDWVILRASVKTAPLRQFEIRREINIRVLKRFRDADIALGAPIIDQVQTTQP